MTGRNGLERYDPVRIPGSDNSFRELTDVSPHVQYCLHAIAFEQMDQPLIRIVCRSIADDIEARRSQDSMKAVANVLQPFQLTRLAGLSTKGIPEDLSMPSRFLTCAIPSSSLLACSKRSRGISSSCASASSPT